MIVMVLLAPLIGALLYGIERKLSARMQARQGPPLWQPLYDLIKLANKEPLIVHPTHAALGVGYALALWIALGILWMGGDVIIALFFHLFGSALLILAGYWIDSTYSHLGSTRELIMMSVLEPILLLIAIGFYAHHGHLDVTYLLMHPHHETFLGLLALFIALPALLHRSPFDITHAHQEIIGGVEIDFVGPWYEVIYTAQWLDMLFVLTLVFLFGGNNYLLGMGLVAGAFIWTLLIDNATARLSYQHTLVILYTSSFLLALLNLWIPL